MAVVITSGVGCVGISRYAVSVALLVIEPAAISSALTIYVPVHVVTAASGSTANGGRGVVAPEQIIDVTKSSTIV